MSVSLAESQLRTAESQLGRARDKQSSTSKRKLDLETTVRQLEGKADKASSDGLRRSYLSQAASKRSQLDSTGKALAGAGDDLVKAEKKVAECQAKLSKARADQERRDQQQADRERRQAERRRHQDEQRRQQQERRAAQDQAQRERVRDAELSSLGQRTDELLERVVDAERRAAPPELTVVFLAASPLDQTRLQIGPETREIAKRIRASEYRDAINVEWLLGRHVTDLIDDLAQVGADVFHFSGHSDDANLVFETDSGGTSTLSKEQLGKLIKVGGRRIRLAVFNSCDSAALASSVTDAGLVEVAIGMSASIGNGAAKVFAGQFYAAIGNGHSIGQAFEEARLQLELAETKSEHLPQLFAAASVEPDAVILVNPDAGENESA